MNSKNAIGAKITIKATWNIFLNHACLPNLCLNLKMNAGMCFAIQCKCFAFMHQHVCLVLGICMSPQIYLHACIRVYA